MLHEKLFSFEQKELIDYHLQDFASEALMFKSFF